MAWGDNKCLALRKANRDRGMPKPYITEEDVCAIEEEVVCAAESFAMRLFRREATFATPVMFNAACQKNANLASCFLVAMTKDLDSIDGIFSTLHRCALISSMSGGLGVSMHDIRAKGAPINNDQGTSQGLLPVMRQFNEMAKSVDQGGGKRRGSCAVYLEMHHPDLMTFLEARHTHGQMERRTHDLFLALWVSDLFMRRVEADETWSFFCPKRTPGLSDVWGEAYEKLYLTYESEERFTQQMPARDVFKAVMKTQANTGQPYFMYKDACNAKSNQQHRGTIRSSNLCAEIIQYTSTEEIAVCNLASVSLPKFVTCDGDYDFSGLWKCARHVASTMDALIDVTTYPVKEAQTSNNRMRPLGLGVSGLWDVFALMRLQWGSSEAIDLDRRIFATIYHAALTASTELAEQFGAYEYHLNSPADRNQLQPDLWGDTSAYGKEDISKDFHLDWDGLRKKIAEHGLRNSLSVALMPTASTAQIIGNTESIEAPTALIMVRRTISGDHIVFNKPLHALLENNGWLNEDTVNSIIAHRGSVQQLPELDDATKQVFRNAWEIPQKLVVMHARARSPYICQGQSLNIHMGEPTEQKLTNLHFATWKAGLKISNYYIRTQDPSTPVNFTIKGKAASDIETICKKSDQGECLSCGA